MPLLAPVVPMLYLVDKRGPGCGVVMDCPGYVLGVRKIAWPSMVQALIQWKNILVTAVL